ncbi:putative transcription-repair-coupling factor [Selenomonas ruminantium subsp. lactilytica TAM6421]|uniref:Transcription-repair-coupling factor n=1 Tax=Selenomonas ruminantium subsp. lactilytica (strain NBRC 103574 / TAM6421) TaxID=927704 RepID=I0GT11_SELRL|nr:transcription-repair coupling factor [Selenomonas ruminantium]BAL83898.1 putative transcription-repair-coupling factor [Selenomonas ruminantium subsp. lactilytica TAM6421]
MNSLFAALGSNAGVKKLQACMQAAPQETLIYGLSNSQKHAILASAYEQAPQPMVIIVHSMEALQDWREDLLSLLPGTEVLELPELDMMTVQAQARSMERSARRMDVLVRLMRKDPVIVLAKATAAVQKGISRQDFARLSVSISMGDEIPLEKLLQRLVQLGYEHADEVERIGQFSSRGGIVDVYPINGENPLRIEFFGDEIDSLREFDLESKRSLKNINSGTIMPLAQTDSAGQAEVFLSYLEGKGAVLFDEPTRLREQMRTMVRENPDIKGKVFSWETIQEAAKENRVLYTAMLLQQVHGAEPQQTISFTAPNVASFQRQMDLLMDEISRWLVQKQRILILLSEKSKADSLRELLARHRYPSLVIDAGTELRHDCVNIQVGRLINGFEMAAASLVVVTEKDIFGHAKRRAIRKESKGEKLSHFRDIKPGDYVVHSAHGIGKYIGVETLDVGGIHKDYLHIKYGGDDKLYVPTEQVNLLQKYIGAEGEVPRLHRMGGTEWAKAKARAKKSVEDIAKQLIEIYAKRRQAKGFAFAPDDSSQHDFEDAFPYQETDDQLKAIAEIKADMEKEKPMDRLLCGDVGFGKTEVAIRAAYKAAMDGKQVAVLVPTTVLAQQHFQTFNARFMEFAPKVDVICRFRTLKEQKQTIEKVKMGQVDILIGTHAILNQNKVQFKNLGLLIVDEEQRFGVKQKDKIRKLSAGIDVLTLSATPIPRTLHMSLVGARDMSIIETPPADRFPVQTYVVEDNDAIIAGAIKREIKRGGQVYFVYNRVDTIDRMREKLEALVPDARIQTAHGQMPEALLERVMMDFYEGEYDILLATSIVENGLDVANANTIIVYNADHFGLSQLYQMRGRVGRSHHMAFAYFVYQADKILTETAEKRLQAMKEFAELGAGFKIAMRDLEIRGAGNLLGSQQHGHIASVGFEMYCKLLEEAVDKLQHGEKEVAEVQPDPIIDLQVEAYIDGDYVSDAMHKIEIYQRIAAIRSNEEIKYLLDELIDRFGEPSQAVMNLLEVARIKNYARELKIRTIAELPKALDLYILPGHRLPAKGLIAVDKVLGRSMRSLPGKNGYRFALQDSQKKKILNFVLRLLLLAKGEEEAALQDGSAKGKTPKKVKK